jgi:hypothetical protein
VAGADAAGEEVHSAGLDVLGAADPAIVGADERREPRLVPEPGQAQGDVGRRSTHVFGRVAVGGVHDVDKQFADDGDCSAGGAIGCARVHVVRGVHDVLT